MGIIETAEATTTRGLDCLGDEHLVISRPSGRPVYTHPSLCRCRFIVGPSGEGFTQPPGPSLSAALLGIPVRATQGRGNKVCSFPSHPGSSPELSDWRTLNSLVKEGMVLSLLLWVGRQDCCMAQVKGHIVGFKQKMLGSVQVGSSVSIAPAVLMGTPRSREPS